MVVYFSIVGMGQCVRLSLSWDLLDLNNIHIRVLPGRRTTTMEDIQSAGSVTRAIIPSFTILSSSDITSHCTAIGTLRGVYWTGFAVLSIYKCTLPGKQTRPWNTSLYLSSRVPMIWVFLVINWGRQAGRDRGLGMWMRTTRFVSDSCCSNFEFELVWLWLIHSV